MNRVTPGSTFDVCLNDLARSQVPITGGATVTISILDVTGSVLVEGPYSAVASGDDWCAIADAPTDLGRYLVSIDVVDGLYEDTFTGWITVTTVVDVGTTLAELRRMVGRRMRTYRRLRATAASVNGGTFTDAVNAIEDNGFFRMSDVLCTHGSNSGQRARITASDFATQTVTLLPAMSAPFAVGDQLDVFLFGNNGAHLQEIDDAINDAIRYARPANGIPVVQTITEVFDADNNGFVALPDHMTHISGIEWEMDSTVGWWYDVRPAQSIGGRGWWASVSDGGVYVGGQDAADADGKRVRIRGYERAETLDDDDDQTTTDPEWIVEQAAAIVIGDKGSQGQRGMMRQGRADALRIKMAGSRMPNTVWIRD